MTLDDTVASILDRIRPEVGRGRVADYIPALARIDRSKIGIAVATLDGGLHTAGDAHEPFSIQSVSKVFTLSLALGRIGSDLWQRVGREPSGSAFNSIVQLEREQGIPRTPSSMPAPSLSATSCWPADGRRRPSPRSCPSCAGWPMTTASRSTPRWRPRRRRPGSAT